jgi:formylglycine-generating enzyme required for sulfatase activity
VNPSANGYRLPTEAEWEYACRAGTTTAYYTGDAEDTALEAAAWYDANSGGTTHPVGKKTPNAWGLYDMHGNVYEWCWDWYGSYSSGAQTDPVGASSGSNRVMRGGSWFYYAQDLRSACRDSDNPSERGLDSIGFRLVCS